LGAVPNEACRINSQTERHSKPKMTRSITMIFLRNFPTLFFGIFSTGRFSPEF
jgi:hypothetical protein